MKLIQVKKWAVQLARYVLGSWIDKHTNINKVMLALLGVGAPGFMVCVLLLVNFIFFHLNQVTVVCCALSPFILLAAKAFSRGGFSRFLHAMMDIKYDLSCPVYFHFRDNPDCKQEKEIEALKVTVKPGDILLRRHKNYLSGIILGQTSYFTHAGLFVGVKQGVYRVMHAVGGEGVSYESIENFCRCEEFVLLRFFSNPDCFRRQLHKLGRHLGFIDDSSRRWYHKTIKIKTAAGTLTGETHDVSTFMHQPEMYTAASVKKHTQEQAMHLEKLLQGEAALFLDLYKGNIQPHQLAHNRYMPILLEQAELLEGTPYDYNFNFLDDKELSCVEFVWFCYKALAPLIQIKRKFFTYFGCIRAFVITPDMFLTNDFFAVKYSSANKDKESLTCYIRTHYFSFRRYYLEFIRSAIGLLVVFALVCFLSSTDPNVSPVFTNFVLLAASYFITVAAGKALYALDHLSMP